MRTIRLAPVLAAGALFVSGVAPAMAQTDDAVSGVGSSTSELQVLGVDAGSLLSLDVLGDLSRANTDPNAGIAQALVQLSALAVDSPALGVSQETPLLTASSTGEPSESAQDVTVVDNPVLAATIVPSRATAAVTDAGAVSGLVAGLGDLNVLGGVLGVSAAEVSLGSNALTGQSDSTQGARVNEVAVLDLEALLAGLGIGLPDLSLNSLLALIDSLGLLDELATSLEAAGLPAIDPANLTAATVEAAVNQLSSSVSSLGELVTTLSSEAPVCDTSQPVFDLLGNLIGQEPSGLCDDVVQTVTTTTGQVAELTAQLGAVLSAPLDLLAGVTLLSVDHVEVSVVTKATDSVDTSVADVTASLGAINVGGLNLPGIDVLAATETVTTTVDQIQSTVGGVLATVDPRLGDLVSVEALSEATSVAQTGDIITAVADFVGLRVTVTPDVVELLAIIESLASGQSVGDQLTSLGVALPVGPVEILGLNSLLAGVPTSGLFENDAVFALSEGLTIDVARINQTSAFSARAAAIPALPSTGSNDGLILLLGGAAVIAALGSRRLATRIR